MFIFYTAISVFGLFLSLFIKKKELSSVHEKSRTGLAEQERVRLEEGENRRRRNTTDQIMTESGSNADMEKNLPTASANRNTGEVD
jgi:hypothetical protein